MTSRRPKHYYSMHPDECRLVRVVAHTPHGAVLPTVFPAPLDGILASVARRRRVPEHARDSDRHIEALPLTNTQWGTRWPARNQWVWAATCATPDSDDTDLRHIHKRWDALRADTMPVTGVPANPDVGWSKAWRIPVVATVCSTLTWWCLGDPDRIQDLLGWEVGVGKRLGIGEGEVTAWEVHDAGAADWDPIWWQHDRPARPIPARLRTALGVPDADTILVDAIRPPYWRPPQTEVDGGGFARRGREVIAPWTTRTSSAAA